MVEFAFGGIGTNPHFGTPANPHDRGTGRIPGGSSSGAAVAVADGLCVMGLGSDTRGSVRIPAALCGVTGFKPTQLRVPREGAFPLSYTLDSVGPLARSVSCCAVFDAILAADGPPADARAPEPAALPSLRLLTPRCFALDDIDPPVAAAFERALAALSTAGARISTADAPCLDAAHALFAGGGFAGAEAAQIHRALLKTKRELYDPNVAKRIEAGEGFFSGAPARCAEMAGDGGPASDPSLPRPLPRPQAPTTCSSGSTGGGGRRGGGAALAVRRDAAAHHAERRADHRGGVGVGRRVREVEPAHAAQPRTHQHDRRLRGAPSRAEPATLPAPPPPPDGEPRRPRSRSPATRRARRRRLG